MKKLPKGYIIENPFDLILIDFKIPNKILSILNTQNNSVYFTRLSIKHLSEKHDGGYIIKKIKEILKSPDRIYVGNFLNRFLVSKMIYFENDKKAHVITIEVTQDNKNIIVTGFISKESYFKNLRLLWGTAYPHLNNP